MAGGQPLLADMSQAVCGVMGRLRGDGAMPADMMTEEVGEMLLVQGWVQTHYLRYSMHLGF